MPEEDFAKKIPIRVSDFWGVDSKSRSLIFHTEDFKIKFFQLNPIATTVWTLCNGRIRVDTICQKVVKLLKDHKIEEVKKQVKADIEEFIRELEREGLIILRDKK